MYMFCPYVVSTLYHLLEDPYVVSTLYHLLEELQMNLSKDTFLQE
jgi:hypothetical protein